MSFIRKLFGGRDPQVEAGEETIEYLGFNITPQPIKEAGGYRVAAKITKSFDDDVKSHQLVRADVCPDALTANNLAVLKAKQVIDFEGDGLFDAG